MKDWLSRKFVLALMFSVAACVGLFVRGVLDGGQFVALAGIILGAFTAGDVALNAIHKKNGKDDE